MFFSLALGALLQTPLRPAAVREAEAFFERNQKAPVPTVTRRALATFLDGSAAYRAKDFAHCAKVLDALWQEFPRGTSVWNTPRNPEPSFNLGRPDCYYALLMLDEACRWKLDPSSGKTLSKPLRLQVVLFDRSEGIQPRTQQELKAGQGAKVVKSLAPELLKQNHQILRSSLWLFQEYVVAITKGRARLELGFTQVKSGALPVVASYYERSFSSPGGSLRGELAKAGKALKAQPDWWWAIYPSQVPDQFPDFARTEFVTGGMGTGPDGLSPLFIIDDQWLIRRPPHMGQGRYEPLERNVYLPNWLQHEFFHHLFARYPQFELEKTSHQWFNRSTWPKDFEGIFEPDYYREALHKRLQPLGVPLHIHLSYAPPAISLRSRISNQDLLGSYEHRPRENDWHSGQISVDEKTSGLRWTNAAGRSWTLHPRKDSWSLKTGPENPYAKDGSGEFVIVLKRDAHGEFTPQIEGFTFNGSLYTKLPASR